PSRAPTSRRPIPARPLESRRKPRHPAAAQRGRRTNVTRADGEPRAHSRTRVARVSDTRTAPNSSSPIVSPPHESRLKPRLGPAAESGKGTPVLRADAEPRVHSRATSRADKARFRHQVRVQREQLPEHPTPALALFDDSACPPSQRRQVEGQELAHGATAFAHVAHAV